MGFFGFFWVGFLMPTLQRSKVANRVMILHTVRDIKIAPSAEIFTQLRTIKSNAWKEKFLFYIIEYGYPLHVVYGKLKKKTHFNCFASVLIYLKIALKNT